MKKGKRRTTIFYWLLYGLTIYSLIYAVLLFATLHSRNDHGIAAYTGNQIECHEAYWNNGVICTFELPNGDTLRAGGTVLADAGFQSDIFESYLGGSNPITFQYTKLFGWFSFKHNLLSITVNNDIILFDQAIMYKHYSSLVGLITIITIPFHLFSIAALAGRHRKKSKKRHKDNKLN